MGNILYKERRLLDVLSLATFKTSQLLITVKEQSNGRCPWDMFIFLMHFLSTQKVYLASYTYRRGLLRCSFYSDGQCEGLKVAGRVTGTDSRAFFIYRYYNSDLTHKNRPVRESAEGHRLTRQAASTSCGFPSSIC